MLELKFSDLFKKYRLKSEFESLSEFGTALAEEGRVCDDSTFTHWQNGKRIPRERAVLITILKIFIKRRGLTSLHEANAFLESANQGYLTQTEIQTLPEMLQENTPFLAPQKPTLLLHRDYLIDQAINSIKTQRIVLLHGQAGIGKSTLAVQLAHQLKPEFPDGVLWYRTDVTPLPEILNSLGDQYNQNISHIQDLQTKAATMRSHLYHKKILYIFDNVEPHQDISLLLPNNPTSAVILTSQFTNFSFTPPQAIAHINTLAEAESQSLWQIILGKKYVKKNKEKIEQLTDLLGHLPLAIQITAKQIHSQNISLDDALSFVTPPNLNLKEFKYENKDLYSSIELGFKKLNENFQKLLTSLAVFHGPDFSSEAVASINNLEIPTVKKMLNELVGYALVEHSINGRYRVHPFIMHVLSKKLEEISLFEKAAEYYSENLNSIKEDRQKNEIVTNEQSNIEGIIEMCYENKKFNSVCNIFEGLGLFLWETGQWNKLKYFTKIAYDSAIKAKNHKHRMLLCNREMTLIYFLTGNTEVAEKYALEAFRIAKKVKDPYHLAFAKIRLGRVSMRRMQMKKAKKLITEAINYFITIEDFYRISHGYRCLSEIDILEKNYPEAKKNLGISLIYLDKTNREKTILTYKCFNYTRLGAIHFLENNLQEAERLLKTCFELEKEIKVFTENRIFIHIILGLIAETKNKQLESQKYFRIAKETSKHLGIKNEMITENVIQKALKENLKKSKNYLLIIDNKKI